MKLKNRILPAMLFFGVVALSSCEKQENETVDPTLEQGMISHVMVDSAEVTSYKFSGKQLSQINHYNKETGELETFEKFDRDNKGRLYKASTLLASSNALLAEQQYTYNQKGDLTKTTSAYYTGGNMEYSSYATYEYSSDKKLEKKIVFDGSETDKDSKAKSYITYEVLPNGNYSQEKQYIIDEKGDGKLYSTTTYSFDSNLNPFHEISEPGVASSPNNVISASTVVHGSKKTYTYKYSYKYDERGYPLSQTVTNPKGQVETFKYLYSN
ncbi:hypothetical protein [Pontibacter ruber]|uniref:YD repeat-containing protein n=1 Tax=Pontibacter ruber TaxID=1343895 RepID=A0ABW5CTW6_9BACT|nr:hypothetical protein [Pontibacter ruber]